MSRIAKPAIAVPAKVYRHFAVVTLMVTGMLALFANGGDGPGQGAGGNVEAKAKAGPDAIQLAAQGKDANPIKVDKAIRVNPVGWDVDIPTYHAPTIYSGTDAGISSLPALSYGAVAQIAQLPRIAEDDFTDKERRAMQRKHGAEQDAMSQDELARMMQQSRERSGSSDDSDSAAE